MCPLVKASHVQAVQLQLFDDASEFLDAILVHLHLAAQQTLYNLRQPHLRLSQVPGCALLECPSHALFGLQLVTQVSPLAGHTQSPLRPTQSLLVLLSLHCIPLSLCWLHSVSAGLAQSPTVSPILMPCALDPL